MIKTITLKSGLRVVTIPQRATKTVTVLVLVGTGSKYETKEQNGISHFLEHMFFKGTEKRVKPIDVVEPLDRIGGSYNAFTSEDYTGYYAKVDSSHFDLAFEWVADIFLNSTLPAKEIQKEKSVITEELHMHKDNPMWYVDVLWEKLLYGDQPAGWEVVGTRETIAAMARKNLLRYRKNQYVASNTVVCIAGNVRAPEVMAKVQKLFAGIPTREFQRKVPIVEAQKKPEILLEYRKTDQSHIALGVRGYNLQDPRRYAQYTLATLLGGMMSSRLWVAIREKNGLAYYVSTATECNPDRGYVVTSAGVKDENVEKAVRIILQEYAKLKKYPVSKDELQKAKDHQKGKMALQLENSDAKAHFYGMQELLQANILTQEEICAKIDKVDSKDIQEIAQDMFRPAKLNLVVLGPSRNKAQFTNLLQI